MKFSMIFEAQLADPTPERAAMLDVLSGGRVDVGSGRGATQQERATTHPCSWPAPNTTRPSRPPNSASVPW